MLHRTVTDLILCELKHLCSVLLRKYICCNIKQSSRQQMQMQSYRLVWEVKLIHVRGKKKKLNALLRPRCNHFNISDQFQSMIPPYSCQSTKLESTEEAYLENIIIIIKVKDHYDWKLYRHFWQFANCEMKEEENFKHWCRCVTSQEAGCEFDSKHYSLNSWSCFVNAKITPGFPGHPRNRKRGYCWILNVTNTLVPER